MNFIKKLWIGFFVFTLLISINTFSQDKPAKEDAKPVYITITTAHRSSEPDVDFKDWLKTEKEYFDKVTSKNDLIMGSGVYFHYFTPDDSEVKIVNVYKTWEDIDKSNGINNKLITEAWPKKEDRDAFFKKQSSYYSPMHSDEIYISLPFTKPVKTDSKKPLIYYVKVNQLGSGGDGFKEYFENVTMKNPFIRGYFTHRHLWGANSRDAVEVFVVDKFSDIENIFTEDTKLVNQHWPDEKKREAFFKNYAKIFAGHGDFILTNVPELQK
jgi:hypothetical protein